MIKVKIFVSRNYGMLENKINHWIEEENIKVVDMKFSADVVSSRGTIGTEYSCLVMHESENK